MLKTLFILLFSLLLSILVISLGWVLGKKNSFDKHALSPFECGFQTRLNSRAPFCLKFFLVALIFIIFDIEMVLLFPFILTKIYYYSYSTSIMFIFLVMILTLGLVLEWNQEMLEWKS